LEVQASTGQQKVKELVTYAEERGKAFNPVGTSSAAWL